MRKRSGAPGARPASTSSGSRRRPDTELSTWAVSLIDAFVARVHGFRREVPLRRAWKAALMVALLYPLSRLFHELGHLAAGLLLGAEIEGFHLGGSWPLEFPDVLASIRIAPLDLYLRVEPNLLAGAHLRWDTRGVWWPLRPLIGLAGPAVTFWIGRWAWRVYSRDARWGWLFFLYAVNLTFFLFGFVIPIPGNDGYHFWRMILRRE